jgi:hypothetical protein
MTDFPFGIEVTIKTAEDFSVIRETLERIGMANKVDKVLNPSCYILHKRGKYFIMHFKEMLELDGKETNISQNDLYRRNAIASLLQQWGLVSIVNADNVNTESVFVFVLPHGEKSGWKIDHKYTIGIKKF